MWTRKQEGRTVQAALFLVVLYCGGAFAAHGWKQTIGCAYLNFKVTDLRSTTMQIQWTALQQGVDQNRCHVSLTIKHNHPRYISQCNPSLNTHLITGLQANTTYSICLLLGCEHSKGQNNPNCQEVTTKAPGNDVSSYIPLHWQR
ncbi:uncharacterized protein LOC144928706 [Branchiostoma floridae x Branchiostoma belcheri]